MMIEGKMVKFCFGLRCAMFAILLLAITVPISNAQQGATPPLAGNEVVQLSGGRSGALVKDIASFTENNLGVLPYLGQVATRSALLNTNGSPNLQQQTRTTHFARTTISSLQIVLPGFYYPGGTETAITGPTTVTASVEYPTGTITRITFGNKNTGTVQSGTFLTSDPVQVNIPNGAMFFLRIWTSNANGIIYLNSAGNPLATTDGWAFGTTTPDLTGGGTVGVSFTGGQYFPAAIIAQTTKPAVCIIGDSRAAGYGDTADAYGDIGELARSVGPAFAYLGMGVGGDQALTASTTFANRLVLTQYCSHILYNYGINDLANSRTAAQLIANINTMIGFFPGKPVWVSTLPPEDTSTDSFATTTNQTPVAWNSARVTFNTDVRAGGFIVGARGYVEMAGAVESSLNSGLWAAPGPYTSDGVHELLLGTLHEQAANIVPTGSITR
jgi:hypothetical protein